MPRSIDEGRSSGQDRRHSSAIYEAARLAHRVYVATWGDPSEDVVTYRLLHTFALDDADLTAVIGPIDLSWFK